MNICFFVKKLTGLFIESNHRGGRRAAFLQRLLWKRKTALFVVLVQCYNTMMACFLFPEMKGNTPHLRTVYYHSATWEWYKKKKLITIRPSQWSNFYLTRGLWSCEDQPQNKMWPKHFGQAAECRWKNYIPSVPVFIISGKRWRGKLI